MIYPGKGTGRNPAKSNHYEIHIKEPIDPGWAVWFEGITLVQAENGDTVIYGMFVDKSALHGLLAMIGELNLTLLSVLKIGSKNQ